MRLQQQVGYYPQVQAVYNTGNSAQSRGGPVTLNHVMESQMSLMNSLNMASQLRGGMYAGQKAPAVPRHLTLSAKEREVCHLASFPSRFTFLLVSF